MRLATRQQHVAHDRPPRQATGADVPDDTIGHDAPPVADLVRQPDHLGESVGEGNGALDLDIESPALAAVARRCADNWQMLQELAGAVTPFTERVEAEIREAVLAEHEAALDAQQKAAASELADVQQKTRAEIAKQLRSRLVELASRKRR